MAFSKAIDQTLKENYLEIGKGYEVHFLETGTEKDYVHFHNSRKQGYFKRCLNEN